MNLCVNRNLVLVLCLATIFCCLLPSWATAVTAPISCNGAGNFDALDTALMSGVAMCQLNADVNSTLTFGNQTSFDKAVTLQSSGHTIFLNNTLQFNGTGKTITFADAARFQYDPNGPATRFRNASLIDINGNSNTITGAANPTLVALGFSGTGLNVSGSSNNLARSWEISGSDLSPIINVSGSGNTLTMQNAAALASTATSPKGINLVGDSNTITFDSTKISASAGKLWLEPTASGNTLTDNGFTAPTVYIYNGTSSKNVYAWYFYNSSWSPSGMNTNPTISVSNAIPLAGNVGIAANFYNVTGVTTDINRNNALTVTSGYSGGLINNNTANLKFNNMPAIIPVNISYGDNTFAGSYQEQNIGTVVILNFDPRHSVTMGNGMQFNETQTTNWTAISDFTTASNLRFVAEDAATHTIRGNLSFTENLDLTDQNIGTGLAALGQNLNFASAGNSIDLNVASAAMSNFNKKATLTVYPTGFAFASGNDVKITATTDAGASTVIYNKGVWNRAGFVADGSDITVGNGYIVLPVLHFSKYDFDQGSGSSGGGSSGGSGDTRDTTVRKSQGGASVTLVNVGGGSAVKKAEVTGTDLGKNFVITAMPREVLPQSITAPLTTVYQYQSITTSSVPGTLSQAALDFSVPLSWITEHGFKVGDIVMMHNVGGKWTTLNTQFVSQKDGVANYRSITYGFSYFAIAYQQGGTNMTAMTSTPVPVGVTAVSTPVTQSLKTGGASSVPATVSPTKTPALPVAPVSAPPAGGIALTTVVAGITAILVVVLGAFLMRRWWIRKQNPTLFRESD